jgi:hypothetical protein
MFLPSELKNWSVNDYADFWRYEVGLNVIPADTRNKRPKVEWKHLQNTPIADELHNYWKKQDMFKDGMMIIAGQVWHNERKKGLFLNCIDLDNELAIQEFCKINGQQMALNVVADTGHFTVEQHVDDTTRAHIFVWSDERPFKKKISNSGDNVPRIEVKGEGNDSLVSVTPSPHTNGSNYEFVGDWHLAVIEPKIHNQTEEHINTICENYGIEYLNGDANANKNYNPVLRNQGPIRKGERHNRILSYANSLIIRNHKTTNKDTIYEYLKVYNNNPKEVEEPLEESELKQIFNDAWDNITTKSTSSIQEQKQQESETDNDSDNEPMTYEDWNKTVMEKYENLKNVSDENLRGLWYSLEFELSVFKILNIKDCTLPFAGILLGAPSSLKTVGIELFRKVPNTFYTDNFSARAIVSHSTTVQKDKLEEIDMLPRMKNKFFLTPELSPIFGKKDDDLQETLSIITRVLDGHGYESDTGAHGHRGYPEDIMFTWVGASVDIPRKVHKYLGTRGAKLYFFRLPLMERLDDEYIDQMIKDDFKIKTKKVQDALIDYLKIFDKCPNSIKENNLTKIDWNSEKDDKQTSIIILKLSKLLAYLRAVVNTWDTEDSQGLDYDYGFAIKEDPSRAMTQLRNLARGHALSQGRNWITIEDMPILIKTVFSTASLERVRIFELLLEFRGKLTTSQIVESLRISNKTAKRTMAEFKAIGFVDVGEIETQHGGNHEKQITLVDKLDWFLSQEFKDLKSEWKKKPPCGLVNQYNDYGRSILLNSVLPRTDTYIPVFSSTGKYYNCYECEKVNHGTPIFQTDSQKEYETHWIKSGHKGTCYPNNADLELHGWTAQGKEWET